MKFFGTDGIRGEFGNFLTIDLVNKASQGLASLLKQDSRVILGQDPRFSSEEIAQEIKKTLSNCGVKVIDLGVCPTSFVSMMIQTEKADAGIMISASHNPYTDNGIKFFGPDGMKLSDEMEAAIEERILAPQHRDTKTVAPQEIDPYPQYLDLVKKICPSLAGLKVALDCANGASSKIAPEIFKALGAEVMVYHNNPDGYNINSKCGALHPENLAEEIRKNGASCGFCYDGDADRLIAIDGRGNILSGDHIMYLLAKRYAKENKLNDNTLVTTVMSNLGLHNALAEIGITTVTTDVGDRFVIQKMNQSNFNIGGEQSGHIILSDYITTGDGVLASIVLASLLMEDKNILNEAFDNLPIYPQSLINIAVENKEKVMENKELKAQIDEANTELSGEGRVLIRASGTEELIRVMAEAQTKEKLEKIMDYFVNFVEKIKQ